MSENATMTETDTPRSFAELKQIALRIAQQLPENPEDANIVAVPPVTNVLSEDTCPTLAAFRKLRKAEAAEQAAYDVAARASEEARRVRHQIGVVTIGNEEVWSLDWLESLRLFPFAGLSDDVYEAARAKLEPLQKAHRCVDVEINNLCQVSEDDSTTAFLARDEALRLLFETTPTSPAGALAIVRAALEIVTKYVGGVGYAGIEEAFEPKTSYALDLLERTLNSEGCSST
jgi:hypothetical protein